jgi:hypothetical protein
VPDEDHEPGEQTPESRLLDQHPGVRELVEKLPEFIAWVGALPVVEVDGETFYVVGGDQLKDRDQVIVEWVRLYWPGLLERKPRDGEES